MPDAAGDRRTRSVEGVSGGSSGELDHPRILALLVNLPEIVLELVIQPALGGRAECQGKTDRHFRRNAGSTIQDGRQCLATDTETLGSLGNGEFQWRET